jgi:GntR family transcriptional regulator, negative regulator for fad regulon and positive regulator of fabA
MDNLPSWTSPQKPVETAYERLLASILNGVFEANSLLPNEYQLSQALGITRSTLREAMQRLAANGLVEIRHGKPTRICDIWVEGNMNTLSSMIHYQYEAMSARWVPQMLEVRVALAPAYTYSAIEHNSTAVVNFLEDLISRVSQDDNLFPILDWELHHRLTIYSTNPIYTLILNGFREYYQLLASSYFSLPQTRLHSRLFYDDLCQAASHHDPQKAGDISRQVMQESLDFWLAMEKSKTTQA